MSSLGRLATEAKEQVCLVDEDTGASIICTTVNLVYDLVWRREHKLFPGFSFVKCNDNVIGCGYICKDCQCRCHHHIINVAKRKLPFLDGSEFQVFVCCCLF